MKIYEKILKFFRSILRNNIAFYFIFFCFSLLYVYFLFEGYININKLIFSLIITLLIALYKLLLDCLTTDMFIYEIRKGDKINIRYYFFLLDEKIIRKNKGLIKPIYYILYYFPTNGPYLIILGIGRKGGDIRLYINSNKDVIGKRFFEKDGSKTRFLINSKYFIWYKKYIFDVFFRIIFLFLYFKFHLLGREGDKFFKYKIFGMVYSTVLIVNNLHIFVGFKNINYLNFGVKVIIIVIFIYIILYLFPVFLRFLVKNISVNKYIELRNMNKDINNKDFIFDAYKLLGIKLNKFIEEKSISNYYFVKEYLIFMCLADRYVDGVDGYYNIYIFKNINKSNINLPSNLIKIGRITYEYNLNFNIVNFYKKLQIDNNLFINYNMIGILEKNYRVSFFLYSFFIANNYDFVNKYLNYELYKTFYGKELIEKYFGKELEELESFHFIYLVGYKGLVEDLKFVSNFNVLGNNDIPKYFKNNKEYNEILELFNIFFLFNKNILWLNYKLSLTKDLIFDIDIIYNDIKRYENIYGNDIKKFIKFGTEDPNEELLNDSFMKLRLEIFSNHIPNTELKLNLLKEKVKIYYNDIKLVNNDFSIIKCIEKLQQNHKNKFFSKKPEKSINNKFFDQNLMKEEGKDFDQK